jgi:hemolysin III
MPASGGFIFPQQHLSYVAVKTVFSSSSTLFGSSLTLVQKSLGLEIFHLWQNLRFQNAIWHAFVLLAAGCHYAAVLEYAVLALT